MITRQDVLTALNEPTIKQRADGIMALIGGSEWISVEDGLPEVDTPVLVRVAYQDETIIALIGSDGSWDEQSEYEEVHGDAFTTHNLDDYQVICWMPLPP